MNRLLHELFAFEVRPRGTPGERWFFRAFELIVGYWVLDFAWRWGFEIRHATDVVLPLGLARYIDIRVLFHDELSLVNAAGITLALASAFLSREPGVKTSLSREPGVKTSLRWRYGYLVALVLLHVQYVARYSQGEISHGSNLIAIALLGLGLGRACFRERVQAERFALGLCVFIVGLGYTSAAVCKLVATGPLWVDGHHLWLWIHERTIDGIGKHGAASHNALQRAALASRALSTVILVSGLVTETTAFLLWWRKLRPFVGLSLVGMHVGIWAVMDIRFLANEMLIVAIALPWPAVIDRVLARRNATGEGDPA